MASKNPSSMFGANGDGCSDDTGALQKALDQGGVVRISAGTYKVSGRLRVPSGTHIVADEGAVVKLAAGAGVDGQSFVLTNSDHGAGNADITVEGGVWDSNCAENPRGEKYAAGAYSGVAMNFIKVKRLTLRNLTVRNPDCYFIRIGEAEGFCVEDIRFDASVIRPNQDGVHIGGFSRNGVVKNLRAISLYQTNDDMVALNADDDVDRQMNQGMKLGPIRDIAIEDIEAESAYTFIRMLSQHCPVENVSVSGLRGGARCNVLNLGRWCFPAGNGSIRNIKVRDCKVRKMLPGNFEGGGSLAEPLINLQLMARNVLIENFVREAGADGEAATLALDAKIASRLVTKGLQPSQFDKAVPDFMPHDPLLVKCGNVDYFWLNPEA